MGLTQDRQMQFEGTLPGLGGQLTQCLVPGMGSAHLQSCLRGSSYLQFCGEDFLSEGHMTTRIIYTCTNLSADRQDLQSGMCAEGTGLSLSWASAQSLTPSASRPSPLLLIYHLPLSLGPVPGGPLPNPTIGIRSDMFEGYPCIFVKQAYFHMHVTLTNQPCP